MTASADFRKNLVKTGLLSLLAFFLIPISTMIFVHYGQSSLDRKFLASVEREIDLDSRLNEAERTEAKEYYRANPPSGTCRSNAPDIAKYRTAVCSPYSELWQFNLAGLAAFWISVTGAAVLIAVCGLGALAFINRRLQYLSFVAGWRLLALTSAVEVIVQGALAVWLSFWLTAFFFHVYSIKLIGLIGIGAALAVFYAIVGIFKRVPDRNEIEGELVSESDAPRLWHIVRTLAAKLKTAPPAQIIAGIDANFFVTEAPLSVGGKAVTGRTLYLSIPLLRLLDGPEAGAVLTHELAHLRGGDTASSAALGPKLVQYDHYCYMMHASKVTMPVYYLMAMYRLIFEVALKRDSREREFLADRLAAKVATPAAVIHSLIKIAAYASYRGKIERDLFEQNQQHGGSLGIARYVASGLEPYAKSPEFLDDMDVAHVPHPFDSHPTMKDRMKNVAYEPGEESFGRIATSMPLHSWADDIQTAADIEQRLWSVYERQFSAAHEENLAYRYEPANDAELAIVLKYFPPARFALKGGKSIEISHAGLLLPEEPEMLSWDRVAGLNYEDGYGGDVLQITHPEKGLLGAKSTKVKLPGISKERDKFKATLTHYWQRHQIMRQQSLAVA